MDKVLLQRAPAEHATDVLDWWDLSQAHRVVADGLQLDNSVSLINSGNVIIWKGIIFKTMEEMKIWLMKYVMFHRHPFIVKHSDENKHCVVICHHGCPWTVHARRTKDGSWRITSVIQPHTCSTNVDNRKHPQLSS
jgi:hypothetical protein